MRKQKVLFICAHNSARSQMAAALLNETCGENFDAQSAGLEPGKINPLVVEALLELGIDISKNTTQRVFDVWTSGQIFQFVVTVCSDVEAEGCPIFAGVTTRLHWPFDDPSKFTGTHEEQLEGTRRVRDQIRARSIRSAKNTTSRAKREESRGGIHRDVRSGLCRDERDCDRRDDRGRSYACGRCADLRSDRARNDLHSRRYFRRSPKSCRKSGIFRSTTLSTSPRHPVYRQSVRRSVGS